MTSSNYDLSYLEAGLEELEPFLLSKKLFWPILAGSPFGEPAFPRLTLGGFLLAIARSNARNLPPDQKVRLQRIERKLSYFQAKWSVAWETKAKWEFTSRLRQWGLYINELSNHLDQQVAFFPNEVKLRVILAMITDRGLGIESDMLEQVEILDSVLQIMFKSGEFIWDQELAPGFPRVDYWYLWGQPA